MSQFNLGWVPLIQQELRKFFASKGQGDKADTALQPGAIGTTVQGYDADLAAIAALTTTGLVDRTGNGTATTRITGATGLAVLAAANEAAARTAIGAMANTAPEIITNANGTAYRWPNGLQVCVGIETSLLSLATGSSTTLSIPTSPANFNLVAYRGYTIGLARLQGEGSSINEGLRCVNGSIRDGGSGKPEAPVVQNISGQTSTRYALAFLYIGTYTP